MKKYKIDKENCLGCGGCTIICPEGIVLGEDGKAQITNQEELERAGGESVCPYGAIVLDEKLSSD
ncbi:MAG: ferredoxin [Candidatus Pacebacteria bacterium]|jgi:ferredoxin|nr:ferredoxin [Candidatus Paceibacterota bacterium]NMB47692.1 ferredoxin [Patescibacteria group bacterium]MDD2796514.1 ferredoxin [Candidatus Paceibacterota bacterium]MDD3047951.1 ferredoxin [Candidatus Paceibacterota bacterium]MDD3510106.1 ferredoxin [Candidatus Paceibacterota bacterium]